MKKIIVALAVLGLLFAPIFSVTAQTNGETVYILLWHADDTVTADAGDTIVLRHRWGACTYGLVKDYLASVHTELSIDSGPIYVADGKDQYWGPIVFTEAEDPTQQYCIAGSKRGGWIAFWDVSLGILEPGEHEVYFHHWMDHPVLDGGDYDQDGYLDPPDVYTRERTITIVVE